MKKQFSPQQWLLAVRPQSLIASTSPVIIGTAMAFGDGIEHFPTAVLCLIGAVCLHLVTNISNDIGDYDHGVDSKANLGIRADFLPQMIESGALKKAVILFATLALLISALLVKRAGWPIAVIAICGFFSALFYTIGKRPLGYQGLGELLVFSFFGPVATAGTYYVQSYEMNMAVVLAGFGPGLLSTGVLVANNLRDEKNDRAHGKNTLVVKIGRTLGEWEYMLCVITACLIPTFIYGMIHDHIAILACSICIYFTLPIIKNVICIRNYGAYDLAIAGTGKLLSIYTVIFSIGWIL